MLYPVIKTVVVYAAGIGAAAIATGGLNALTPATNNIVMRGCLCVGRIALSGLVSYKAMWYMSNVFQDVENAINMGKKIS